MIQKIDPEAAQSAVFKSGEVPKQQSPIASDDLRYFKLTKPITVGAKTFDRLLLDASELSGNTYFSLVSRFRKEFPEEYRSSFNKLGEERFLSYIVAELNPPMIVEDVQKITFKD